MKLSIITVTYNSENTIQSTLDSLYNQSFQDFEHIIVDGDSTDKTLEIIKNNFFYDRTIISEKDYGIYDALNKGIKMAKGDYVGILHSDDTFADKTVLKQIVENVKGFDGLYGNLQYIDKNGKIVRNWFSNEYSYLDILMGWMPPHPTVFLKRSIYENNLFNTKYSISADYDFLIKICKKYNLNYLPQTLVQMKIGGASNSSLKINLIKSWQDLKIIHENRLLSVITLFLKKVSKLNQFWRNK